MTTIFSDAQIVKVMDTYEDLVAEFGGDDGLALSTACNEVEVENAWEQLKDEIYDKGVKSDLKIEVIMFDTDTLKKVRKRNRKFVVRSWWQNEFIAADPKYFDEDMRQCEKCGDWEKYFNMSYDDDTGFHLCEDCEDSDYYEDTDSEEEIEDCVCGNNYKKGLVNGEMRCEDCDIDGINYKE